MDSTFYATYISALKSGTTKPRVSIELLRKEDESAYSEITSDIENSSGNLTATRQNGVRKSIDLTLINIDGKYIPDFDNQVLWFGQKFRLNLGLNIDGIDCMIPQGIFVLDNPTLNSEFSSSTVNIRGLDKFALLDGTLGGELTYTYIIPVGSNIYSVIKNLLIIGNDKKEPILDSVWMSEITPYTITKEMGSGTIGEILIELAGMLSANCFYNELGQFVFEPDKQDSIKGSGWDFTTEEFAYQGSNLELKYSEIYNAVLVVGDNINGTLVSYKAQNNNLLSKTSIPNLGVERIKHIQDVNITTLQQATDRANYELKRTIAMQASGSLSCIPMYHLNIDDVITLTDVKNLKLDSKRFLMSGYNIPLQIGGKMSVNIVDSTEFPFAN